MGRGNTCVFGDYEGLYYVDWDNFSNEYEDEHGNIIQDYDFQREEWENSLYEFISDFTQKFKSFSNCNEWISKDEKAILENKLFYIAITDNEWSMAIKLIQKEQGYYENGNIENLQAKHYKTYLEGIKDCLFNQFEELGTYAGPWTSGRIRRPEKKKKEVKVMRTWKRKSYKVVEKPFDFNLHEFDVIMDNGEVVGTITPATLEDMKTIIADLDAGEDVNGWEDGMGNTIYIK